MCYIRNGREHLDLKFRIGDEVSFKCRKLPNFLFGRRVLYSTYTGGGGGKIFFQTKHEERMCVKNLFSKLLLI